MRGSVSRGTTEFSDANCLDLHLRRATANSVMYVIPHSQIYAEVHVKTTRYIKECCIETYSD